MSQDNKAAKMMVRILFTYWTMNGFKYPGMNSRAKELCLNKKFFGQSRKYSKI